MILCRAGHQSTGVIMEQIYDHAYRVSLALQPFIENKILVHPRFIQYLKFTHPTPSPIYIHMYDKLNLQVSIHASCPTNYLLLLIVIALLQTTMTF